MIIGYVIMMLHAFVNTMMMLASVFGVAFVLRFLDGLERPWTVKR